jgi:hypothetical protein
VGSSLGTSALPGLVTSYPGLSFLSWITQGVIQGLWTWRATGL